MESIVLTSFVLIMALFGLSHEKYPMAMSLTFAWFLVLAIQLFGWKTLSIKARPPSTRIRVDTRSFAMSRCASLPNPIRTEKDNLSLGLRCCRRWGSRRYQRHQVRGWLRASMKQFLIFHISAAIQAQGRCGGANNCSSSTSVVIS